MTDLEMSLDKGDKEKCEKWFLNLGPKQIAGSYS